MVRRSVNNQEEAEAAACRHFERGLKSKEKGEVDEACRLLRCNPSLAAQFLPGIRLAVKRAGGDVAQGAAPVKRAKVEEDAAALGVRFLPQYTKFSSCPNQLLRFLLSQVEPQLFSPHALAALNAKGARECPREHLAQVAEFVTGIGADEVLPSHCRLTLESLVDYLRARNDAREHRAFCLRLPPDWAGKDGLFEVVEVVGSEVSVVLRPTPDVGVAFDVGVEIAMCDVVINNNWSENAATLCVRSLPNKDWNLNQEFARCGIDVGQSMTTVAKHSSR